MTIDKHEQHPLMSDSATLIQEDTDILTASSMPMLIKVHGMYTNPHCFLHDHAHQSTRYVYQSLLPAP